MLDADERGLTRIFIFLICENVGQDAILSTGCSGRLCHEAKSYSDTSSDIDVLVEFEPGHVPGLAFIRMQDELAAVLGRKIDFVTPKFLNHRIRDRVLSEMEVQYAEG
jgi:hypothetical protein